jgi:hypothetical protein
MKRWIEDIGEFARLASGQWRLMSMWKSGEEFLVVLGDSKDDCLERLPEALAEYTLEDVRRLASCWLELWLPAWCIYEAEWLAVEEVDLTVVEQAVRSRPTVPQEPDATCGELELVGTCEACV